jgi:AcrR family transcriptional regulator
MPISDCEVKDPRIRRTRQLLQSAIRKLLESKSLDEISVQDITDAATVNRATFYDHYTDKFTLFQALVAGGFHSLLHERNVKFDGTCSSAVIPLVLAACDYLTQTHAAGDCQRHRASQPLMDAAITTAIGRVLMAGMPKSDGGTASPALSSELIGNAASWAIYGAVKQWFETPNRAPAAEVAPQIAELVVPLIEAIVTREFREPLGLSQ